MALRPQNCFKINCKFKLIVTGGDNSADLSFIALCMYFAEHQIRFSLVDVNNIYNNIIDLSVNDRCLKQELGVLAVVSILCLKCENLGHVIEALS